MIYLPTLEEKLADLRSDYEIYKALYGDYRIQLDNLTATLDDTQRHTLTLLLEVLAATHRFDTEASYKIGYLEGLGQAGPPK